MHLGFFVCIERLSGWVLLHVTITCKTFYQAHYLFVKRVFFLDSSHVIVGQRQSTTMALFTSHFHSDQISISAYVHDITNPRTRYDIDPPHQRGLVKTEKWNIELIVNLYEFGPMSTIYYHVKKTGIRENLDGKQRTNAIIRYKQSKFALPKTCGLAPEFCGYFKDLPLNIQSHFDDIRLTISTSNVELTHLQVSKFFSRVQRSSNTTSGEGMNADLDNNLRNMIRQYNEDISDDFHKYCTLSNARFQCLFLITKCVYLYVHFNINQRLPSVDNLREWGRSFNDTKKFVDAMFTLCKVIKFMHTHNIKQVECHIISLFMLAVDVGLNEMTTGMVRSFDTVSDCFSDFKMNGHPSKAVINRYMYLKGKIDGKPIPTPI